MSFFLYILFLVLLYVRPVEAFSRDLEAYRPMVVVGAVAFLAAVIQGIATRKPASARARDFFLLAILVLWIAMSRVMNGWMGGAAIALSEFSTSIFLFSLTVLNLTSLRRLKITLGVLAGLIVLLCVASTVAFHFGFMADQLVMAQNLGEGSTSVTDKPITAPADDTSGRFLWRARSLGFLNDPNDFGQVIVLAIPLLFLAYRPGHKIRTLFLVVLPASILLYAMILTHSRGAILGTGAILLFGSRKYLGNVRSMALLGIFLAGLAVTNATGGRGFSSQEESAGERVLAWSDGLNMLRTHPLFGVGYGNFLEHHEITAHNSFVLCFSELGLIGYFIWLAMIVAGFRDVSQVCDGDETTVDPELQRSAGLLRCSVVGFLTCAFFLSRTYSPSLFLLLGLCAAAWHCAGAEDWGGEHVEPRRWFAPTAGILAGSLLLVYVMVISKHATG